ncbi:hypothetical protein EMIT0158MI4_30168 [Burkholderia ambifaria]
MLSTDNTSAAKPPIGRSGTNQRMLESKNVYKTH